MEKARGTAPVILKFLQMKKFQRELDEPFALAA
jgi:hypothetical protein